MVPLAGLGPARYRYHWILSPARLPIPPQRQAQVDYNTKACVISTIFLKIREIFGIRPLSKDKIPSFRRALEVLLLLYKST